MDRDSLTSSLSSVPVQDLLAALPSSALRHAATELSPQEEAPAKRPLNAFMAFRTYYIRIFPSYPQKTISLFLTRLWNQDPQRNKWALIAKVYSFARDQLGKSRVKLGVFLDICCPMMEIMGPADYLETLGWVVQGDEISQAAPGASAGVSQDASDASDIATASGDYPTCELSLLTSLVESGYLPTDLLTLVNTNKPMMTLTSPKKQFIDSLARDPYAATAELLGPYYDHSYFHRTSIYSWETSNLNNFHHIPITIPYPTYEPYPFHDDERPGVPTSMPFDSHFTPAQRAYEQRLNEVAGAWDMDDIYVVEYFDDSKFVFI
ncbi:hypothetical protein LCI18_002456 [Fusarium solani-melongenae]|uniref:Uncharacterized protein n=1 Tax=Fusarium solani subsp. cucurbitae TaxID=2747967 RepID=A0ACD3YSE4_FUSSC|nr:hypothetical protein LCI18_002456 [Fusarium solani-melongenae]